MGPGQLRGRYGLFSQQETGLGPEVTENAKRHRGGAPAWDCASSCHTMATALPCRTPGASAPRLAGRALYAGLVPAERDFRRISRQTTNYTPWSSASNRPHIGKCGAPSMPQEPTVELETGAVCAATVCGGV